MVYGWRRAFCTSISKERVPKAVPTENQNTNNNILKPTTSKFGLFSNPSTPKFQSSSSTTTTSRNSLRCASASATAAATPESSVPNSQKLECKISTSPQNKTNSPRLFNISSSPSSPLSPSSFSLLKSTLRFSKSKCGICLKSVKTGQGKAIFTAECSHMFHIPCIVSYANTYQILVCPVCNTVWKDIFLHNSEKKIDEDKFKNRAKNAASKTLRVYDDDEHLMSLVSGFNPIPEIDEYEDNDKREFEGFFLDENSRKVDVRIHPEAVLLGSSKSCETYAVALKIRAPLSSGARFRAPLDLVTLIDVSCRVDESRLQMMKRAMRLVISSLNDRDRLSIVVFSTGSKRMLPLKRMTPAGKRVAWRVVDALVCGAGGEGVVMSIHDALKKSAKVLEDRREKNPVSTIIVLSDGNKMCMSSTRFSHLDVPVHAIAYGEFHKVQTEDAIDKCLRRLLSVVLQDLRVQLGLMSSLGPVEIVAVYSLTGRSVLQGSGLVRVGNMHAEEERDLLVEIKSSGVAHHVLSIQSSYIDPWTQKLVYVKEQGLLLPKPQIVRSSIPGIERLRNLHVAIRAIAESRRLIEYRDYSGAQHLLSSARALLFKSSSKVSKEFLERLEAELAEVQHQKQAALVSQRQWMSSRATEEKAELLTPTSAWRAAERLAKLAMMRKSMNRVSDLHGFENARF